MSDLSSLIQTILSVPESHRFMRSALADFTAGGELLFREEVWLLPNLPNVFMRCDRRSRNASHAHHERNLLPSISYFLPDLLTPP